MTEKHCATCVCGKRAPVQSDRGYSEWRPDQKIHGPGTISWAEHELAWSGYAARYGKQQSAERLAERGGFSYGELLMFLGKEPETWAPLSGREQRECVMCKKPLSDERTADHLQLPRSRSMRFDDYAKLSVSLRKDVNAAYDACRKMKEPVEERLTRIEAAHTHEEDVSVADPRGGPTQSWRVVVTASPDHVDGAYVRVRWSENSFMGERLSDCPTAVLEKVVELRKKIAAWRDGGDWPWPQEGAP